MSETIEDRVVSMRFDNSNFEKNVKTSMSTLDKLKESLNFKNASKGLEAVEKASKKVDFSYMGNAVDQIGVRFNALQVVATTALANITNAAVNTGKRLVSAVTIDPLKSGFSEYETQMKSIQTILSNTRQEGTNLKQVTGALDELNTYADQTIYNFTEMTRNIGTFTAAGVTLDTSVQSIKGIANLAAISGSTSQQASTAMYQLSQALAAGRVSLMDWNSVVNAGMGGKVFQDALLRTSEILKTGGQEAVNTYGSFRESLTKGEWLTTEVLTETLKQLSGAYSEADLMAQGYTESQAKEIVALAEDAKGAATNVRTFTQLIDTTMEALGSGWTNTWEILVGDFEEATNLWTKISQVIGKSVDESSSKRNELLQSWKDLGGRDLLIASLSNAFEGLLSIIKPIQEAFKEVFPPITVDTLMNITKQIKELTENFKLSDQASATLKSTFKALFSIVKAFGTIVGGIAGGIKSFVDQASQGINPILKFIESFTGFTTDISSAIGSSDAFSNIISSLGTAFGSAFNAVVNFLGGALEPLQTVISGIGEGLSAFGKVFLDTFNNIGKGLSEVIGKADLGNILDVFNSGMLATFLTSGRKFFDMFRKNTKDASKSIIDIFKDFSKNLNDNITGSLDAVRGSLEAWQTNIKADILIKIAAAVAVLVGSIAVLSSIDPEKLTDSLGAITVLFVELIGSMTMFTKLNTSLEQLAGVTSLTMLASSILILAKAMKQLEGMNADEIGNAVVGIAGLAAVMTGFVYQLQGMKTIGSSILDFVVLALAIKLLAKVAVDLGQNDFDVIAQGIGSIGVLMSEIVVFSKLINSDNILHTSASMIMFSAAIKVMQNAVNSFGSMKIENIGVGLAAIAASLIEFTIFANNLPNGGNIIKAAAGIFIMSIALDSLVPVMERLGALGLEGATASVIALGGAIKILVNFMEPFLAKDFAGMASLAWALPEIVGSLESVGSTMETLSQIPITGAVTSLAMMYVAFELLMKMIKQMDSLEVGEMVGLSVAMPLITSSLLVVSEAMAKLGNISMESAIGASIAITAAMQSLEIGLDAVKGKLGSIASLMLVSVALVTLASAISLLSNTGIAGVAISFVSLAGSLTIVGLATKIMKPLIPSMYSFAGSIATLGLSLVSLGFGVTVAGTGLIVFLTGIAGALATLALINPLKAAMGIGVLAASFATIAVAAKLLKPLIPSIMSLSVSIAALGGACFAVSLGISVLVAGLTALGTVGEEGAMSIVNTLKALIVGISEAIPQVLDSLLASFEKILVGLLDMVVRLAPKIAESFLQVVLETFQSLNEYGPQIATFFIDFLIQMLNTVGDRIPEVIPAISNFVDKLMSELTKVFSKWGGVGQAITIGVGVIGAVVGLIAGLNAIQGMIPGAMKAALGVGLFIAELGVIIAALGAIQQATGATEFIESGGDLLQSIGTAIGQFVGGLVGGIGEGLTSTLPQIATSLSQFMINLTPFLAGASMISPDILSSVKTLVETIMILTGAGLLESISSFISGGEDFGGLSEKLVPFGKAISDFSDEVSGIDVDSVLAASSCGQALAILAGSLPKSGGLAAAIFGNSPNIEEFGNQLTAFGGALKSYSATVTGIDIQAITLSAGAGQALATLASTLPKSGGLAAAVFGENPNLSDFGNDLTDFGYALKSYSIAVADLDIESIKKSSEAGQALATLAGSLPDSGGLVAWLFGDSNLSEFGTSLVDFGEALKGYVDTISEISFSKINSSITAISNLATAMQESTSMTLSDDQKANLANLSVIGESLAKYYASIADYDVESLSGSISVLNSIKDFIASLVGLDTSGIVSFQEAVNNLAAVSLDNLSNLFSQADLSSAGLNLAESLSSGISSGLEGVKTAVKDLISGASSALDAKSSSFSDAGSKASADYASGIQNGVETVTSAVGDMLNAAKDAVDVSITEFYDAGANAVAGFVNGINDNTWKAEAKARAMADAAVEAAKAALAEHSPSKVMYQIGDYAGQGFVMALDIYKKRSFEAGYSMAQAVSDGASMLSITYESFGNLQEVIDDITNLANSLQKEKKEDTEATEKDAEENSKLAGALSSVADSTQQLLDRKNDLAALKNLLGRTGASLSEGFLAELMASDGSYAGALSEMVNLTDQQLHQLSVIYDQSSAASSMENMVATISNKLLEFTNNSKRLKSVQSIFKKTGVKFSKGFIEEIIDSSGDYADCLSEMVNLTDEQLQKISDLYDEADMNEKFAELADALMGDASLSLAFQSTGIDIETFVEKLADMEISISDATSSIQSFAKTVSDGFSKMSIKDQTGLKEFMDNLENNVIVAGDWSRDVEAVFSQIANYPYAEEFRKAVLEGGFGKFGKIMHELAGRSTNDILEVIELWNTANIYGKELGEQVYNSVAPAVGVSKDIGLDMSYGMSEGLKEGTSNVTNAVIEMCSAAENATREYFGINSPSKLMMKLAGYVVEGFVKTLNTGSDSVYESMGEIFRSMDYLKSLDEDDLEIRPVIKPVIDLDDLKSKIDMLNTQFGSQPSVGVMAKVNSINAGMSQNGSYSSGIAIKDSVDKLSSKIDSINPDNFGVTYQQINNSPKALSTADIYRQTRNQISLMRNKSKSV